MRLKRIVFLIFLGLLYNCSGPLPDNQELLVPEGQSKPSSETNYSEESKPEEESSYSAPNDCFSNPFMNCYGASLGNYLNAYYIVGDFETFYAFINNSAKRKFGKSRVQTWFNTLSFGYSIDAINIVNRQGDFGVLVYQTDINNTRGRLMLPFVMENDTAKLYLTTLDSGIEGQYDNGMPNEFMQLNDVALKLEANTSFSLENSSNSIKISLGASLLFDSGKHMLNAKGKKAITSVIKELKTLNTNKIQIECIGYADPDVYNSSTNGDLRNNLDLSVMRASTVAQYLIENNVVLDKNCIASGMGDAMEREAEMSKAQKRRVEIVITL